MLNLIGAVLCWSITFVLMAALIFQSFVGLSVWLIIWGIYMIAAHFADPHKALL